MIRDSIKAAQLTAMKSGEKPRLAAVRLILAKLKDRDIELRTASSLPDDDTTVVDVLQKMAKQRRESIGMYIQGGRQELADAEKFEITVLQTYMPQPLSEDEVAAAVAEAIASSGAKSPQEMGKVIALLKPKLAGRADMGKVSALVKARLA